MGWNGWAAAALLGAGLVTAGCGGSSSEGDARVRLVNATDGIASVDFYADDDRIASDVGQATESRTVGLDAGSRSFEVRAAGSSTTEHAATYKVSKDESYTIVVYSAGDTHGSRLLGNDEDAPDSGESKLRVLNASTEAGDVDVYVTAADADLADATPAASGLGAGELSGYDRFDAGTWRIRVTGSGDTADVRLDLPAVTLASKAVRTLVLTRGGGGVLVHGLMLDQDGGVTALRNTAARVRLVAGAGSTGKVAATVAGTTLSSGTQSPSIGAYKLVTAGTAAVAASLGGTALAPTSLTLTAGNDYTLLVTSSGSDGQATLLTDDNRPPTGSGSANLRVVHGIGDLASPVSLTADYALVAGDVNVRSASAPADTTAAAEIRLEATSPGATGSLFLSTDTVLTAGRGYTLFLLGSTADPVGVLRRDR